MDDYLKLTKQDFSVMTSKRCNNNLILLGSIAFVNHDCDSNCVYDSLGKDTIGLVTSKNINIGDEILTYYGASYFGEQNKFCECLTCEKRRKENIYNLYTHLGRLLLNKIFILKTIIETGY